jgi:hypothetical protein
MSKNDSPLIQVRSLIGSLPVSGLSSLSIGTSQVAAPVTSGIRATSDRVSLNTTVVSSSFNTLEVSRVVEALNLDNGYGYVALSGGPSNWQIIINTLNLTKLDQLLQSRYLFRAISLFLAERDPGLEEEPPEDKTHLIFHWYGIELHLSKWLVKRIVAAIAAGASISTIASIISAACGPIGEGVAALIMIATAFVVLGGTLLILMERCHGVNVTTIGGTVIIYPG